jgi:[CysO sulfur-carrier protein]-thiocarboxylate-dependent cysteine synthase
VTKIRIPPTLRAEVGGSREVESSGETVRDLLADLAERYPGLGRQVLEDGTGEIAPFVNVYLNSEDVRTLQGLDTPVEAGSTLILLPAMAGGERTLPRVAGSLLDLVGSTPLVELRRLAPHENVRLYAKLEGQNPTGSLKDRVAKAMIEAAEARGELQPGRELLEPTSGNTGIALAMIAKIKGYPLTCVLPENATEERVRLLELYGAEIVEALPRVDALVAGLGTGGTLMGAGERVREAFPEAIVAAAEPLQGDHVYGLRSLDDGYTPPILDVSKLDRKILVTNEESVLGLRMLLDREGIFAGVSSGAVVHVARRLAAELDEGVVVAILPDGGWKYLSADFWTRPLADADESMGSKLWW